MYMLYDFATHYLVFGLQYLFCWPNIQGSHAIVDQLHVLTVGDISQYYLSRVKSPRVCFKGRMNIPSMRSSPCATVALDDSGVFFLHHIYNLITVVIVCLFLIDSVYL